MYHLIYVIDLISYCMFVYSFLCKKLNLVVEQQCPIHKIITLKSIFVL